jgi:multiple sugar transport system permease protein
MHKTTAAPKASRSAGLRRTAISRVRLRSSALRWLNITLLLVISVFTVAPMLWTVSTSLRPPAESFTLPPQWLPRNPDWSNYAEVFRRVPFARYLWNSATVTFGIIAGQLVTASLAGYAFARLSFPGKRVLFWLVLATLMIPLQATIIPVFVLISRLRLADTLTGLIIPAWPTAFGAFLLRQYFLTMPNEYGEAAVIDGAGQWQVFRLIYLPMALPALAILSILSFNGAWNEYFRPLIFLTDASKFTLPLGLVSLSGYMGTGSVALVLAGVIMSLIPVLIVYIFGQRYLIEGIARGGLKG